MLRTIPVVKAFHKYRLFKIRLLKKKINIVFFVYEISIWKLDDLLSRLQKDDRFDVFVVICPNIYYPTGKRESVADETYNYFSLKGVTVKHGYDFLKNQMIDIKKLIDPDVIFFTNPYDLTYQNLLIENFYDRLTCYVPYGMMLADINQSQYNLPFHNFLWKHFVETDVHREMSESISEIKGSNVVVSGYPSFDEMSKIEKRSKKNQKKIIIWAPHHTIEKNLVHGLNLSNFIELKDKMLELSLIYKDSIEIVFKPHPLLKNKLESLAGWTNEEVNSYYESWNRKDNRRLEEGSYLDLFMESDAMILDSVSFMAEYLYTGKPIIFTEKLKSPQFNKFGELVYSHLYKAKNFDQISEFIRRVVLNNEDELHDNRNIFFEKYLLSPDVKGASHFIYQYLCKSLF